MSTITSLGIGSGLDLNGLLDDLEAAERSKLEPIVKQQESHQATISAYGQLEGALGNLQSATAALNDPATFQAVGSDVRGDSVQAAASANAVPGQYQVEVMQLAQASSVATQGVADTTTQLGAGTFTFTFGNGDTLEVEIDEEASSLAEIRDAINAKNGGVSASIINDGSEEGYRLVLASSETGTDAAITNVDFGTLGSELALDADTQVAALDAKLKVNNVEITSQSNMVDGAIQGVTLSLMDTGNSTITVRKDTDVAKQAISDFVDSYNALRTTINQLTSFNAETGAAGELLGDSTLRSIESQLRGVLNGGVEGDDGFNWLHEMGISLKLDGTLELNSAKLDEVIASDPTAVEKFFVGSGNTSGLAKQLDDMLGRTLADGGQLDNAVSGLESKIDRLDQQYSRTEQQIETTLSRYRTQFTQLDMMIAQMNQTSDYLTQQFEMMNAQLNRS
ncbi:MULTISPECIES: flagellar filament capping protein FliD [Halomonadaceae]|uniref:flagellar filament capping protein FliD n=1 Tax=Halomonadaceae TaxID=28256 RepID=UPI00159A1457|nr:MULTISPECIES: flagellar filament capping protein FliD [Halomonas]QJQ94408.1 flagellar filament capping protein FliD [Halomonas sp. PA5]